MVHRDLKPENILFDGNDIKLIDFGLSCRQTDDKLRELVGSPFYVAPEVLKKSYDHRCDVWSLGVMLFIMLTGYPPFNGPNNETIFKKIEQGTIDKDGSEYENLSS